MRTKLKNIINISNFLTVTRVLITPVIVMGIVYNSWFSVFLLFILAALTDSLDGYFARILDQNTEFGACLDPIADKILLVSSFTALCFVDSPSFSIPVWFVFVVFFREAVILGGSIFLFLLGIKFKISPSVAGKMTTFFQLSFILWLFVCYFFGWNPVRTYYVLLILLSMFSLASLFQYSVIGYGYLGNKIK